MTPTARPLRAAFFAGALALTTLTACGGGGTTEATKGGEASAPALDPILASPQVGDLYTGELTAFSAARFGPNGSATSEKAYGMMRVVAVDDSKVTVITEQGAWPTQTQATAEFNSGSMDNISWDESERIPITRSELAAHVSDGKLAAFRRP
jgi:hypothetical protein